MSAESPQPSFDTKLSAAIGLFLSLLFVGGGLWVRQLQIHEHETLRETQGTVVDSVSRRERDSEGKDKTTHAPVIEFEANGKVTRFTGSYQSYQPSPGNSVVVRYDSDQPDNKPKVVDPLEGLTPWGMLALGGFGVVCSLGDLFSLWRWLPWRR